MAEQNHNSHGASRAAWTAVGVMLLGCFTGTMAVITLNAQVGVIAALLVVAGAVAGKVMSMMGMGQPVSFTHPGAENEAEGMREPERPHPEH